MSRTLQGKVEGTWRNRAMDWLSDVLPWLQSHGGRHPAGLLLAVSVQLPAPPMMPPVKAELSASLRDAPVFPPAQLQSSSSPQRLVPHGKLPKDRACAHKGEGALQPALPFKRRGNSSESYL